MFNEREAIKMMLEMIGTERKSLTDTYNNLLDRIRLLDESSTSVRQVRTNNTVDVSVSSDELEEVKQYMQQEISDLKQMIFDISAENESLMLERNKLQQVNSEIAEQLLKANYEIEQLRKDANAQKNISTTILLETDKKVKSMSYDNKKMKDMKYAAELVRQILRDANGGMVSSRKIEKEVEKLCGYRWKNFTTAMNTIVGYDRNIVKSGRGMYRLIENTSETNRERVSV